MYPVYSVYVYGERNEEILLTTITQIIKKEVCSDIHKRKKKFALATLFATTCQSCMVDFRKNIPQSACSSLSGSPLVHHHRKFSGVGANWKMVRCSSFVAPCASVYKRFSLVAHHCYFYCSLIRLCVLMALASSLSTCCRTNIYSLL